MATKHENEASILNLVEACKRQREEQEAALAETRARSRELALQLVFELGYPLLRVERLTGHYRATLRSWIAVALADGQKLTREQYDSL